LIDVVGSEYGILHIEKEEITYIAVTCIFNFVEQVKDEKEWRCGY